jgi:hypothetical protein
MGIRLPEFTSKLEHTVNPDTQETEEAAVLDEAFADPEIMNDTLSLETLCYTNYPNKRQKCC